MKLARNLATQLFLLPFLHIWAQDVLLPGYGNYPWNPICAQSCLQSFRSYLLNCTDLELAKKPFDPIAPPTPPSCYASDPAFLTSAAWCFFSRCPDESIASLEAYWQVAATGLKTLPPRWSYTIALDRVSPKPPAMQLTMTDISLNQTSLLPEASYLAAANGMVSLYAEQVRESKYSITLLVFALGLPIVLTWGTRWLPFCQILSDKIKPYLIYPSLLRRYNLTPLPYLLGNVPTLGQTLYITLFTVLNILLAALGYRSYLPNAFYLTQHKEILNHVTIRTGAFAFVLLPILLLFSSRNNILLFGHLTRWPHSTYLLLHRWVARLFLVHVAVHSIAALQIYSFFADTAWWDWGVAATVLTVVITLGSGLYVRRARYDVFLVMHVVLAVLILVGSWYHLVGWYAYLGKTVGTKNTYGYEIWLYFAFAVWGFDRLVRVGRMVRWGVRRARVTEVCEGRYVRVDVPGVRWSGLGEHVFVCFPSARPWTPWESHPFSVIPTHLLREDIAQRTVEQDRNDEAGAGVDVEKQQVHKTRVRSATPPPTERTPKPNSDSETAFTSTAGITLFIRKSSGLTSYLKPSTKRILTLLDGPYPSISPLSKTSLLQCDRLLIVAGGIGITGALPWAHSGHPNVKLVWSVKEASRGLADALHASLGRVVSKEVRVGSRFDVQELIEEEEKAGWDRIGVVGCGPGGLCDDLRAAVVVAGRRGRAVFELEIDSYSL
ncbi:ferric reductase-like transmembrane component [Echria macrotheca]|uniref:Ferric reductase-like transmembrane component n=1 Tax=Echria macrotheca TaxID=438768 RepID=A0AAJ0B5R3_9PEZI|nr:ferric reductase-like transmembrane component [Echria macrotheca]